MTGLDYIMGVCITITAGLAIACWQMNKPKEVIIFGLLCWVFIGAGFSAIRWRQIDTAADKGSAADLALKKLAEQSDAQLRPYVGVSYVKATMEIGKSMSILIKFTNTGKTPAEDTEILMRFQKVPIGTPINRDFTGNDFDRRSVGSINVGNTVESEIVGHEWTLDELMQVTTNGTHEIFANGIIRYHSKYIPGGSDDTLFCYEFDKASGQMVICRKRAEDKPTANTSQRPWVTVKSVRLGDGTVGIGQRPTVFVEFENSGQAPAITVRAFGIIGLAEVTDQILTIPEFPMGYVRSIRSARPPAPAAVMGAGAPYVLPLTLKDGLSQIDAEGLKDGTGRFILVYGLIDYESPSGGSSHMTTFAFRTNDGYNALVPWKTWNSVQ
ncbi:MAG: hypothetical protein A3I61_15405 [Acidobacteria bacterium RIFCSPLOWO2_02_FULL_68_18]|nr:MAG: hypothetical protein A3I61_15405 [Acidobacteria bacterium RIFCSPLOWO2_02_FULL_68_18]OFW49933.1 MAG: hypothetical protein A3G77_08445 [Acidobacteria bacterium RIFCSPLOWO2_12_FULL_68_19]